MLVHWIWLATRQGLNKRTQYELARQFGDPETLYQAQRESLIAVPGMTPKALNGLADKSLDKALEILNTCRQNHIEILTLRDAGYPQRLLGIYDPPIVLYYRGQLPRWEAQPVVGAVGTRSCSDYGLRTGETFGQQLSLCGGCVVSGLAEGIDAAILSGVLSAGGKPAVFLAGGVDVIYPAQNRNLYDEILSRGGCVLSEQPPGTKPYRGHFPIRNRLISGISHGVLVVEAPEKSGALITARHAMEQGREVYVVPGPVDADSCRGSNGLLKDGAIMVQNGWDILEPYCHDYEDLKDRTSDCRRVSDHREKPVVSRIVHEKPAQSPPKQKKSIDNNGQPPYIDVETKSAARTPQEQAILKALAAGPKLADGVIDGCGLPKGEALAVMTMLEIEGIVQRLPGNLIALKKF